MRIKLLANFLSNSNLFCAIICYLSTCIEHFVNFKLIAVIMHFQITVATNLRAWHALNLCMQMREERAVFCFRVYSLSIGNILTTTCEVTHAI
jgi:hypothetical protein